MRRYRLLGVVMIAFACGCAESLRFASSPPGATIYVNDELVGDTPVEFTTKPGTRMNQPWRYRVEYKGTPIRDGEIGTHVSAGRISGYIFTAGILALFRSVRTFDEDALRLKFFVPDRPPAYFSESGTGSIVGQAFAVTLGGDVKPAAGRVVVLHPDCNAIRDYYAAPQPLEDEGNVRELVSLPTEEFTKTTIADAGGNFQFDGLASGRYTIATGVNWTRFAGFNYSQIGGFGWVDLHWATEGGPMIHTVEVKNGQTAKVVMAR